MTYTQNILKTKINHKKYYIMVKLRTERLYGLGGTY